MSHTAYNTIQLAGKFRREEGIAGGTITPGMLVEIYNSSGSELVRAHSTAGGNGENAFAVEDPLQGKTATSVQSRTIDDDYVVTERVSYNIVGPGAVIQAWLKDGENVVKGDKLISSGDGTLKKTTGSPLKVFAVAEEALDLSASSNTTNARINVRVL